MLSKKDRKEIKEEMDRLYRKINDLDKESFHLKYEFTNYQNDMSSHDKFVTNKLREMEKAIGYLVTENKTFKMDLIKDYINARGEYKKYRTEHRLDTNEKILADPYCSKLIGRIGLIGDVYKFLYDEPISDGIVEQYVNASNEDKEVR